MATRKVAPPPLTDDEIGVLTSFADGEFQVRRKRGKLSHVELQKLALDANVEMCPGCRWWVDSGELIPYDSDDPDGHCCNCRPKLQE